MSVPVTYTSTQIKSHYLILTHRLMDIA
jgi:hypothetical protein